MFALTKYYTETCTACKTMAPILEEVAQELNLELRNVNCEDLPEAFLSIQQLSKVPTVTLAVEGEYHRTSLDRFVGLKTKSEVLQWVKEEIAKYESKTFK